MREQAPYGTGNYAVTTNVPRSTACSKGVCTFTDTQAALQPYKVARPNLLSPARLLAGKPGVEREPGFR